MEFREPRIHDAWILQEKVSVARIPVVSRPPAEPVEVRAHFSIQGVDFDASEVAAQWARHYDGEVITLPADGKREWIDTIWKARDKDRVGVFASRKSISGQQIGDVELQERQLKLHVEVEGAKLAYPLRGDFVVEHEGPDSELRVRRGT